MTRRRLSCFVLAALASACHSSTSGSADGGTEVSGAVVEANGGAPIASAQVCILDHPEVACATTDSAGAYTLTLPELVTQLDLAVNATASGHLGFTGIVEEPPASDGGVNWFHTIELLSNASAAALFADAGFSYPAPGKSYLLLSIFDTTGVALAGETATLSPLTGAGPVYYDDAGVPDPQLTSLTVNGQLLFGGLTPGKLEITVAGAPCAPIDLGIDGWSVATPQSLAGEAAADSLTPLESGLPMTMNELTEYSLTPSLLTGPMRYTLEADGLIADSAKRQERTAFPYAGIASVRLTFIQGIGRCELHRRDGKKLVLTSRHFRGVGDFVDQNEKYNHFIETLHARLPVAGAGVRYIAGTSFGFALGVIVLSAGVGATLFLLLVGGWHDAVKAAAPLLGSFAVALPLALLGRAKPYRPEALPANCMPATPPGA